MLLTRKGQFARKLVRILSAALVSSLCAGGAWAQSATFAGRDYPALGVRHVVADFNGDGRPDIAGAGQNVSVALGNGDGTFRPKVEYRAGGFAQDLLAADFNGDGRTDLAVTNNEPQVSLSVLLGNGDGTFGAPASYPNDTGLDSPSIAAADFDHDGRLDLVIAHQIGCYTAPCVGGDSLTLMRGNGDGTFQPAERIRVGLGPAKVVVSDFNADGHADLAVAAAAGKAFILLGLGDGTFTQLPDLTIVPNTDNTDAGAADFNGDGIQDLVFAADGEHRTVALLGNGDGTFRQSANVLDGKQQRPGQLTISDFNGDGFKDVALGLSLCCSTTTDGMLGILYGNGDGTFRAMVRYLVPGFVIGNAGGSLLPADFNGDGRQDILLQIRGNNPGSTVLVNSTGRAPAPLSLSSAASTPSSVVGTLQSEINVSLAPGAVAPSGSLSLQVSSSNSSVVQVPSSVRIIAGMGNIRFRVNTARVNSPQTVTIKVSGGSLGDRSTTLTVTPPTEALALGSLQVQPSTVFGGRTATGTISLTTGGVAPSGGALVSVTNDNPGLVSTPFNVLIPAGQSSASFNITTGQTGLTTPVNITATYNGVSRSAPLTVSAPSSAVPVSSVTLSPQTVVGGSAQAVRVLVTLGGPAPPERATVSLSSSDPSVVRLPASIQIEAGTTSGFADFTTSQVSATRQVTINATYGGSTQGAVLSVTPQPAPVLTLASLTLSPSTLTGGAISQGTVTLSAPAPSATVINLSSSSGVAGVPASVTVGAGSSSAVFNVSTTSVASPTSAIISAVFDGTTRTATLNINPPATTADRVSVQKAEYDSSKRALRVEATSTSASATLQVFVTSTGQLLGTLSNVGGGKYTAQLGVATNPQNITVRSSLGGSATSSVLAK